MSDQSEHKTHPTVEHMERVAKDLFRNAESQEGRKPDLEPERVRWWKRVKAWHASIRQAISKYRETY